MTMLKRNLLCAAAVAIASSATAEPVITESGYFGFIVAIDSQNFDQDVDLPDGNPAIAPVNFDVSLTLPEPEGGNHFGSASGHIESVGSTWTSNGSIFAAYPSGLEPGVDVLGNPNPPTGTAALLFHNGNFTLNSLTTLDVSAQAMLTLIDPANPSVINGLYITMKHADDTEVFTASLAEFTQSGTKSFNQTYSLPVGDYSFSLHATLATLDTTGAREALLDFSYEMDFIVPTPASVMLLLGSGLLALRRR
jgi:hypothetical protein